MDYQIELRHLKYFQILAEELHYRKAAERLFISQPGLSRQIKQMEELLNVKLFERSRREVQLTAAGKYLKLETDKMFLHFLEINSNLEKIAQGVIATLKLGFIGSAVQTILPQLLKKIKKQYPSVEITLSELSNEKQMELLLKNELDFGFARIKETPLGLKSLPIFTEKFMLVLPKNHPKYQGKKTKLLDFKEESFILFSKEYSHSYYDLIMSIFLQQGFQPKVSLRTVNALTIFTMVEQHQGIAIVPTSLQKGYVTNVEFVPLNNIPQQTTLFLVWKEKSNNPAIPILLSIFNNIDQ
ncbi:LysR family transcriptional regulator [Rhizosphaericola mali]|uniref:LysR family transcriptional regulator n=1 Tax=Rhizosphaericola mali TaxID=2545455 RepID=A0A5P2FZZ8_9BACT|nr:LysR family transcriptional regulator [Rhizosphaericola mali]QES89114.1 LysR family transcriptional regulator [Rhizosphaericola mali]